MPRTSRRGRCRRTLIAVVIGSLLASLIAIVNPTSASAVGTVLFQNAFNDRTVDGTGTATTPTPVSGPNTACLTATGNSATLPLLSCSGTTDLQGSGKLQLTPALGNKVGAVFGQSSFPTSNGLDVTFNSYQWGGGNADGIAFMLAAVDPANPVPPTAIGSSGGALGYSAAPGLVGLTNAYLGVGLDTFGNFSNSSYSGTGCTNPPNIGVATPGAVVVRGPGNVRVGYCGLSTTWDGSALSKVTLHATTRAAALVPVEVLINPTNASFTSASGVSVSAGTYKVVLTPIGQLSRTLTGALPTVPAGLYPATSWLNAGGVPKQLAFGFVGSTGSVTDVHEISDTKVLTFNPVPQLGISTTSYTASAPVPGGPVTYTAVPSVLTGTDETNAISVTQTVPAGVTPVGAYGTGWVCQPPVGLAVTCTTTATSFANGTTLPAITVVAIVTGSGLTAATIQAASTTRASSVDANPGTDSFASPGTLPIAPSAITANPAIGSIAGGGAVLLTGTNIAGATAVEIGTATEQQTGVPVTLLPCPALPTAGCFSVAGGQLTITSMPARSSAAAVSITVVTAGVAAAASYVYADKPAIPAAPTATAGITSATVSWVAPANNGSPITGYVVTPYLAGAAQPATTVDASATSRTITGLTAAASYTFTVAAINAYGTSTASAQSSAVIPYALPAVPTITALSAGTQAATLTWTAPASNGSTITGYVVTPYIGATAQTSQSFSTSATTQSVTGLSAGTAYTFTVAAQNLAGTGPPSARSAAVTPNVSPSLTFAAPPAGEVGVAYSRQLTVTNGTSPFAWSISSGALPGGLTLNATTGLLSGNPTAAGSFPATIQVVDASGQVATKSVTIVIAASPAVSFTPAAGEVNVAYSQSPVLTGGTGPFVWALTAGSLPAGLTLNASTGLVSGNPTTAGTFSLTLTATDALAQVATTTVAIVIVAQPIFTTSPLASAQVGVAYAGTLTVSGGSAPLVWSITAGNLPPGLTLNPSTGAVSGTPTTSGNYSITAAVVDGNAQTASRTRTYVVAAGPLIITKTANVSSAAAGSAVAYTITIANTAALAFTGVAITDPLTAVLDDATYNADAASTTGTIRYTAPNVTWTGDIGASATVTITYSVTVNRPDIGNKVLVNAVSSTTLGTNCPTGSADPRCAVTVTVPGLVILKTADVASTTPGSTVHFTVVISNSGQTAYPNATFTDTLAGVLDDASYNADAVATLGNISYTSPLLTWTGALAVGASATISYSATVTDPDTGNRTLAGTIVSASAGSPCPSGSPAPGCTASVTVLVPALSLTSAASPSTTTPGGVVTYTLTLANTGQTGYPATSATFDLSGALDDAVYNADAIASAGSTSYNGASGVLTWTGSLALGAVVTVTATVTVGNPDTGDHVLTTAAASSAAGSTCAAGRSNALCVTSVAVLVPALTITSSADVSTTTPGSVVHYTVTATNTGQTAYPAATFNTSLSAVLDDAAYNADAAATSGTVGFTSPTLSWTGALAIGATATITYSVTVHNPDTGNLTLSGSVVSPSAGNNCPSDACTTSVTVLIPALTFTSTASPATSTTPGSVVSYSATVHNTGQTAYTGVLVTLDVSGVLDDATYNNDAVVTSGDQVPNPDGTVSWTLNLAPGASATTSISMTVNNPDTGDRSLHTIVASNAAGSTCRTGSLATGCQTTVAVLVPGLTITKTASASSVTPGDPVSYTITVLNNGQTAYPAATFTDDLSTVLTDATYAGGATTTTGNVSYSGTVLTWTGALAPGGTATINYSVTVLDPDPGDKRIVNTVVSSAPGNNCLAGSADPRCSATVDILVPGLTILATANAATTVPGAIVRYTVTVTNSGATAITAGAVTDSLTGVLDDAAYNSDATTTAGTVALVGSGLTWTGGLAVGAAATISYSVTVHAGPGGDNLMSDSVSSTTRGANCTVGGTDPRCAATVPVARLVITQSYPQPTTTPGSVLHLSASFVNTGQVPYTGITIASPSADSVDDATPGGDEVASSGTLILSSAAITWTGSIPIGGTVTVSGSLTVLNPDPGNKIVTGTLVSTAPGNNCLSGSTDSRCTALVTVLLPGLTITTTASTSTTVAGAPVGYTITVQNTGQTGYTGAVVTASLAGVLDEASYNNDAAATRGVIGFSSPTLTWTGDLAVGASATITYSVTVRNPDTGDKTMISPVSSTAVGSSCPPASGNPACRSTVLVLTAGLTILKTANVANATLGSVVTYTVTISDSGQTSYPAAAFSDSLSGVLDDASYNADAVASTGTVSYANPVLSWSGALSPGGSASITYSVSINLVDVGNQILSNTVVSTNVGNNCLAASGDSRCTSIVTVTNSVTVTFTKSADVAATVAGAVVHYTVQAVNSSVLPIAANFTDPLTGSTDDASYNGDAATSAGTLSSPTTQVSWSGTIPATTTITVTYSVTVHLPVTGDQILADHLTSSAPAISNNCLSGSTDPRCSTTIPVAGLLIQQSYLETTTTPGSLLHLSATFTNTGMLAYNGIRIASPSSDVVDDAVPTGDEIASSGTLVLDATGITWTGNIPVGGVVTISGTLTVNNPDGGNKLIAGSLTSSALGNNCPVGGTDARCRAAITVLLPALTISKSANTTFVVPGGTASYTITVQNSGQTPYVGAVVTDNLAGVLDDASYNGSPVVSSGVVSFASPVLTWTGDLLPGATATITYSVTAADPDAGDKTMVNPVVSTVVGSSCPVAGSSPSCRTTVAVLTPALTVALAASTATTVPGGSVTYTLTVTNSGQVPYAAATVSVPLSGLLADASYNGGALASSGTVSVVGQVLTWTGPLAAGGASATISYAVIVNNPDLGSFRLAQTVTSTSAGSNCGVGSGDPRCTTSVPVAGLQIRNVADVATTQPTGVVRNTVTVSNVGQVAYSGISLSDSFVGSLDDATYNGDATASSGSLVLVTGSGQVVWTGDLAVGGTLTVTGSLTANNPDSGDKSMTTLVSTSAVASNCSSGGSDPTCLSTVAVLTPGLTITTAASTTTATPGDTVGYVLTIANTGQTSYLGATVSDRLVGVLNDATYHGDASSTRGSVVLANSTLTWTGDLSVGQLATVTFSVTVNNPDLGDKNMITVVGSDNLGSSCPSGTGNPLCTTLVTVLVPVLDIAVAADRTTTVPGADVGYTITVRNTGQVDYSGATVTMALGAVLDDASAPTAVFATAGSAVFTNPNLIWTGDVTTGSTVIITYVVTVHDPDTGDQALTTALNSTAPGSSCGSAAQCANTVTVLTPGLAVSIAADASTATPGDAVAFTVTIANTGQTAYSGTSVSVSLADVLDDATFDGATTSSAGVANYAAPNVTWVGNLEVGASVTVAFTAVVANPDPGNRSLEASVVASATGSSCPAESANPGCAVAVAVLLPALHIASSASAPTTTPGGVVRYTVVVDNVGQTNYAAASVTNSLSGLFPDSVYNGDASVVGGGTLTYVAPSLAWTGALPIGASATITYSITVRDPDPGDKAMTSAVTSSAPGSSCPVGGSSAECATLVRVLVPGLVLGVSADSTSVVAGSAIRYTVTVTNSGQTDYVPATFSLPLGAGVLDDATYAGGASASIGSVADVDDTLVWTGALPTEASATVTYVVTTVFPGTGDHRLVTSVSSPSAGANCRNGTEAGCTSTVPVLVPALTVTKTADRSAVVAGGAVRYTISATNTGQADYPSAQLSDSLAGVLGQASYNGDGAASVGNVGYAASTLTWSGPLARNATVLLTYSISVDSAATGDVPLANRVVSPSIGSTCLQTSLDPACVTSTAVAARSITLSGLTSSFTLTGLPNSTVTANAAVGLTVTTNSPGGYVVTVQPANGSLAGAQSANSTTIPIDRLSVRESGTTTFVPLSVLTPLIVHQQTTNSAPGGDAVSNDYQVDIPFVPADTYSTTLDYIASTQ